MNDTPKPKLLTMGMMQAALRDPKFLDQLPEFRTLQPKIAVMERQLQARGCSACKRRRMAGTLFRDFLHVVLALDATGQQRLRTYYGGTPLMVSRQNKTSQHYETLII